MATATIPTTSPAEARKAAESNPACIVDVRTPAEYREMHIPGSTLSSLGDFDPKAHAGGGPIYLICKSGARSKTAAEKCAAAGVESFCVVEGGIQAWAAEGLPVVRGKKGVSLERQVRMVVGAGVLAFSALGFLVHPGFHAGAAFFGAGLLFAGITDTCGMAIMLAKMPWNRACKDAKSCSV